MITLKCYWPSCSVIPHPACSRPSDTSASKKKHWISQPRVGRKQEDGRRRFSSTGGRADSTPWPATIWLGRKTQKFFGTNQMPERLRPCGTGLVKNCPRDLFRPCLKTFVAPFVPTRLTAPRSPGMCRECYSVHQSGFFSHENAGNGRIAFDGVAPGKLYIFCRAYRFENVGRKQKRFMSLEQW